MSPSGGGPLLSVSGLKKHYPLGRRAGDRRFVRAVDGVDLEVSPGETIGLIGESGSGKSTLGRMLLRLEDPTEGSISFDGKDITSWRGESLRLLRRRMNMVFQNPYSAMSPRHRIGTVVAEPLAAFRIGDRQSRRQAVNEMLARVGLPEALQDRYPDAVSGGQLQRVAIARALVTDPDLLIADEPTASLDVSVRAQVINLLQDLVDERNLSMIFISHDLRTVSTLADSLVVMYLGRVVERGPRLAVEQEPLHPYTRGLIQAMPRLDAHRRGERRRLPATDGRGVTDPHQGCPYQPRCPLAETRCVEVRPELEEKRDGHFIACHLVPRQDLPVRIEGTRQRA